ncbi:Rieske 2Fe-2S domain-containing protein, partial [Actinomadura adrarensis]
MTEAKVDPPPGPADPSPGPAVSAVPAGFPMPRDAEMLFDESRRTRVIQRPGGRFPFPVPNGWFIVARSSEVEPGDIVPLYYFGRELVLYRGHDGAPYLVDAHCPHLGAHLAVGGE